MWNGLGDLAGKPITFFHGKVHPLICSSCGAPLIASPQTGIAVCEHCGSHAAMRVATAAPSDSLNEDLKHVEEWWNRERRPLMTQDRQGHLLPPEEQYVLHVVLIAFGAILGLIAAAAGHKMNWDVAGIAGFFLFPILISLPAALMHQRAEKRFKAYEKLKAEYEARRSAIMERHARRA